MEPLGGQVGALGAKLGGSWNQVGRFWSQVGNLKGNLRRFSGCSKNVQKPCVFKMCFKDRRDVLGTKMELLRRLGATWGQLGSNMSQLEATWSHLGAFLEPSWAILEHLGANLGSTWGVLGQLKASWDQTWANINPPAGPCGVTAGPSPPRTPPLRGYRPPHGTSSAVEALPVIRQPPIRPDRGTFPPPNPLPFCPPE